MGELTTNALRVLGARYLCRDAGGRAVEDWEGLCERVSRAVAAPERELGGDAEAWAERFLPLLLRREFLPNSPTLMNAGLPDGQLAACFVLPVEDSLESLFEALKRTAVIHRTGGGTGFSFSRVRPRGDAVQGMPDVAAGPLAFLGLFDAATDVIVQGGRRRGANMGVLRADHPDIEAFVAAKLAPGRLTNFNLSVLASDAFFGAAEASQAFDLVNPRDGKVVRSVAAGVLLDAIAHAAWTGGDPGLVFADAVERANPTPLLGRLEATNPCGELPLLPDEACNLGSLRLDAFVRDGEVDFARLDSAVALAVRFLDDVIEASCYPDAAIARLTRANRKIGLGVMGFADLLVELGVPYDAPRAVEVAEGVMARIHAAAERASAELAEERGVFANFEGSRAAARGLRLRNASVTSIAPTGTLSILADCAGGIEPYFALAFTRHVLDGQQLPETNTRFERRLERAGAWSEDLMDEVRATGAVRDIASVPESVRRLFPTASDVPPETHLAIQAAFQRHVDNAVSKTINLPAAARVEDVRGIYLAAWRLGLKGITVFREGCRESAVLLRGADRPGGECCG